MADFWSATGLSTPPSPPDAAAPPAAPTAGAPVTPPVAPAPAKAVAPAPAPAKPPAPPTPPAPAAAPVLGQSTGLPGMPPPSPKAARPKAPRATPPALPPAAATERPSHHPAMVREPQAPPPRQQGVPVFSSLVTVLVLGGAFAVYRYVTRPPVPTAADDYLSRSAEKPPADPVLQFLLSDEPEARRPERKPPTPATQPVMVRPQDEPEIDAPPDPAPPAAAPPVAIGAPRGSRPLLPVPPTARFTTRDPNNFVPVGLRLQAIDGKSCTINDRVYYAGDRVDNYIVSKIAEDAVVLRTGRTLIELKLEE